MTYYHIDLFKITTTLEHAIKDVPVGTTCLDIHWATYQSISSAGIVAAFKRIPVTVTRFSAGFCYSDAELRPDNEIKEIFLALPASITHLSFEECLSMEEGIKILPLIPETVRSVNLTENIWCVSKMSEIIPRLPETIKILCLGNNPLGESSPDGLKLIFQTLPAGLLELDLNATHLDSLSGADLAHAFSGLPRTLIKLGLRCNKLWRKSTLELVQMFQALPPSIRTLDLDCNDLHRKCGGDLMEMFGAIPATIENLLLTNNGLGCIVGRTPHGLSFLSPSISTIGYHVDGETISIFELAQAFSRLPSTIKYISLEYNHFYSRTAEELEIAFGALPKTVRTIDFSHNNLGSKTDDELVQIFSKIHPAVTLILNDNSLFHDIDLQRSDQRMLRLSSVPRQSLLSGSSLRDLCLDNNGYSAFSRALAPLISLYRQKPTMLCADVMTVILSYIISSNSTHLAIFPHMLSKYLNKDFIDTCREQGKSKAILQQPQTSTLLSSMPIVYADVSASNSEVVLPATDHVAQSSSDKNTATILKYWPKFLVGGLLFAILVFMTSVLATVLGALALPGFVVGLGLVGGSVALASLVSAGAAVVGLGVTECVYLGEKDDPSPPAQTPAVVPQHGSPLGSSRRVGVEAAQVLEHSQPSLS